MTNRASGRTRGRRGIILVACVGILGVLSVMAMAFASVMRMEARAARNFTNAVRAEFAARAGVEDAISRLRSMARDGAELPYCDGRPASWYTWSGTAGGRSKASFCATEATNCLDDDGDGLVDAADADETLANELSYADWVGSSFAPAGDTYSLRVEDAASKVNVNAGDNLGVLLDNLCRVIGPPLAAAEEAAIVPRWFTEDHPRYRDALNAGDTESAADFFYSLDSFDRPVTTAEGRAVFGDGYAIAGFRARKGAFLSVEDVRNALTWTERGDGDGDGDADGPEVDAHEERMEIEAKYAALRPYITVDSWVDTDQVGYGKFEHVVTDDRGYAVRLVDRNATWNSWRNDGEGELKGCLVAIVNGVGQGQFKTIASNTIDTIVLDESVNPNSAMRVPPNHDSSYVVIGADHRGDAQWRDQARLYARQPLSVHRAPVNVNTATDKVLLSLTMGLQTNWGPAGYYTNARARAVTADAFSLCPSVLSVGRDANNAHFTFELPCPNDSTLGARKRDPLLATHGHPTGAPPYCFFCGYGRAAGPGNAAGDVNEAHYIVWQLLKEREQSRDADEQFDTAREKHANGHGPFRGWDDLYFRVFRPWERASERELSVEVRRVLAASPRVGSGGSLTATTTTGTTGHPGIARLCMANFNSNTDILKFQPNLEWVNRWGANFTDLYVPHPDLMTTADIKLRVRPGELLDKSDLNIGTTEFTFDSGGVYEVVSTGRVYDEAGLLAEKQYAALVRVYDVWRESTQREFVGGTIDGAAGTPGTSTAGQIALDRVSALRPNGGSATRKALCTYPEAIVPGDALTGAGSAPALALGTGRDDAGRTVAVAPAGYDGQIMLATNSYVAPDAHVADDVGFCNSFTGDIEADFARGNPRPSGENGHSIDEAGLFGILDSTLLDLPAARSSSGEVLEGEGPGGDLRPDGLFLGVVGTEYLDGSLSYEAANNYNTSRGAVSMWVKPMWHHGTYMRASLPVGYNAFGADEMGSTVPMRQTWRYSPRQGDCRQKWPGALQRYTDDQDRDAVGYVRDRFEHELFNAVTPAQGWAAKNFRFAKMGDAQNSLGDQDVCLGIHDVWGSTPFGALQFDAEGNHGERGATTGMLDMATWIPGWLYPDSKPFYQVCPFRWFFTGIIWNYRIDGRPTVWECGNDNDGLGRGKWRSTYGRSEANLYFQRINGQPIENSIEKGLPMVPDYDGQMQTDQDGATMSAPVIAYGDHKDKTASHNLTLAMMGRPFVDTMRSWDRTPRMVPDSGGVWYGTRSGTDGAYDLESWAMEHYGTMMQGDIVSGIDSSPGQRVHFGINRKLEHTYAGVYGWASGHPGRHAFQKMRSGTYATVDEFTVYTSWKDPLAGGDDGFEWPRAMRRPGRYYFDRTGGRKPAFTSQGLFDSEAAQNGMFTEGDRDEVIELGTVRWTVFTPYYCIHQPGISDYEFPYDSYFLESQVTGSESRRVSQSWRPGPASWTNGPQSRNSSQRGCTVSIESGPSPAPVEVGVEYDDPEAWSPVLARGARTGQHARSTPEQLKYVVRFGFSRDEYRRATQDSVLLDSPVFDDITITYMRRPKVLVWRDVSE